VWLQRIDRPSTLVRLGVRLNLRADLNTPVAVLWTEERLSARAIEIPSSHTTVVGRTIAIETASLPPGRYAVGVAMARGGAVDLVAETDVIIRP
jgi:hypothetical protein